MIDATARFGHDPTDLDEIDVERRQSGRVAHTELERRRGRGFVESLGCLRDRRHYRLFKPK